MDSRPHAPDRGSRKVAGTRQRATRQTTFCCAVWSWQTPRGGPHAGVTMPAITPLLRAFLTASETRVELLAQQERDRLAEREQLVAEREAAQGKIDLAQRNVRRVQRRWASVLLILTVLVVLGTGAGLWVVFEGWRSLMVNRSEFIAGIIDRQTSEGDHVTAMLLGLEALPDPTSESIRQRWLPVEMTAMHALDGAWRNWRTEWGERAIFDGIQIPSRPSSSRPTARASSPAPGTTRRDCGVFSRPFRT